MYARRCDCHPQTMQLPVIFASSEAPDYFARMGGREAYRPDLDSILVQATGSNRARMVVVAGWYQFDKTWRSRWVSRVGESYISKRYNNPIGPRRMKLARFVSTSGRQPRDNHL